MKFEDRLKILKETIKNSRGDMITLMIPEARAMTGLAELALTISQELRKLRKSEDTIEGLLFLQNRYEKLIKSLLEEVAVKEHNKSYDK